MSLLRNQLIAGTEVFAFLFDFFVDMAKSELKDKSMVTDSRLYCELCSGHGHIKSGRGWLPCHDCSAAASSWIPASQPPASEPNPPTSRSITVWGVVVTPDGSDSEKVAYWPARGVWTATRMDSNEPADVDVEVSHSMYAPELPPETRKDLPSNVLGELQQEPISPLTQLGN